MHAPRIEDDPELLAMFIKDMGVQSDLWKPTAYWTSQCKRMQAQLERTGLSGFRTNWSLMRGVDLGPKQAGVVRRPIFDNRIAAALARRLPIFGRYERHIDSLVESFNSTNTANISREVSLLYQLLQFGECSSALAAQVEDSCIGNPNVYEFDGKKYSSNMLVHICLVSLLFRSAGDQINRVMEIGGGYGVLAEIMQKRRFGTNGYFVEVDIPPLVYVSTQYLKAVFPGRVVDYREARSKATLSRSDIEGKILVIPPCLVPALDLEFDLFWNSASFQEMEGEVVDNYLEYVSRTSSTVFINTLTHGHRKGLGGQREPIAFDQLARKICAKGYQQRQLVDDCAEMAAFRSVLPRHSIGVFARQAQQQREMSDGDHGGR